MTLWFFCKKKYSTHFWNTSQHLLDQKTGLKRHRALTWRKRSTLTCLIEAPVLLLGRKILMSPNSLNMAKIDLPNTSNVTRLYVLLKNKRYPLI